MAQSGTEWKPNRRQKRLLDAAQESGVNRTITQICKEVGVPRRTFYNWLGKEGFEKAWDDVWRRAIVRHMPGVVAAMVATANKGNTSAARLLADMAGAIKQRHEITGAEINIQLAWDDAESEPDVTEAP